VLRVWPCQKGPVSRHTGAKEKETDVWPEAQKKKKSARKGGKRGAGNFLVKALRRGEKGDTYRGKREGKVNRETPLGRVEQPLPKNRETMPEPWEKAEGGEKRRAGKERKNVAFSFLRERIESPWPVAEKKEGGLSTSPGKKEGKKAKDRKNRGVKGSPLSRLERTTRLGRIWEKEE